MANSILVIEDEPNLRGELTSALSEAVFEVADASNYLEALGKLGTFKADLVILDEALPLIDGWEACYQLRRDFGIPVILLGADYREKVWVESFEAGADLYLRIPFSCIELVARVKAILRRYKEYNTVYQA